MQYIFLKMTATLPIFTSCFVPAIPQSSHSIKKKKTIYHHFITLHTGHRIWNVSNLKIQESIKLLKNSCQLIKVPNNGNKTQIDTVNSYSSSSKYYN